MRRRRVRQRVLAVLLAALLVGGTGAAAVLSGRVVLWERCTVRTPGGEVSLSVEQAANAATIAAVGRREGLGERGVTIALATAMQESKLRNLDHGDRDSLGLFQQRPSQGWGSAEQVRDPVHAARRFYRALKQVRGYRDLSVTDAAQRVQRSAYGDLYQQHAQDAAVLTSALTGRVPGALGCGVRGGDDPAAEREGGSGLTPRAETVRAEVERAFGDQSLGGFAPGGVRTGHVEGSAHYEGRALDVSFRPVTAARRRDGWALACWAVANAARLRVRTVIYDDRVWSAARSGQGWRPYTHPDGPTGDPVRRHLDHVHLDVA